MRKDLETLRDEAEAGTIDPRDLRAVAEHVGSASADEDRYTMLQIVGEAGDKQYRPLVERFLESPDDPMLARLALEILAHYWGDVDRYLDQVKRFLHGVSWDDQDDVRQMAIFRAGDYLLTNPDEDLLADLIRVVTDKSEDHMIRQTAYLALGWAMGMDRRELPPASRIFDVEAEIGRTDLLSRAERRLSDGL
jgi:HEAT repeat protein